MERLLGGAVVVVPVVAVAVVVAVDGAAVVAVHVVVVESICSFNLSKLSFNSAVMNL